MGYLKKIDYKANMKAVFDKKELKRGYKRVIELQAYFFNFNYGKYRTLPSGIFLDFEALPNSLRI